MLCASEVSSPDGVKSEEYLFNLDSVAGLPNITVGYQDFIVLSGSVKMTNDIDENSQQDLDEILSPYGVFSLIWDVGVIPPDNLLKMEWKNPVSRSSTISVDYQKNSFNDIIAMTFTGLYYFDDLSENENAFLSSYSLSPCTSRGAWQQGETINLIVNVKDTEGDTVSARAILYYGTAQEQDSGWSGQFPAGTNIPFSFNASTITPSATLRILVRDSNHPNDIDAATFDIPFSVGATGTKTTNCTDSISFAAPSGDDTPEGQLQVTPFSSTDNVVINSVRELAAFTKLGVLGTFLLILVAINIWLYLEGGKVMGFGDNHKYTLVMMGLINFIVIIIGTITFIIPLGLIILFVIVALLVLAFAFKDRLGGGFTGGG